MSSLSAQVEVGIEALFTPPYQSLLKGKRVGLITNQTGVTSHYQRNIDFLLSQEKKVPFELVALFAPEHGINGAQHAAEEVSDIQSEEKIPIYSLHGKTRRPTEQMLRNIDVLIFDIQDIGSRSYTYITTLFYVMEEAAKYKKMVIVADRPNPINGLVVDGPMLEESWRSFLGYVNIPYCHGMTAGELAKLFNEEYKIGCNLKVIPMNGWKRKMSFTDTSLPWVPTSPNIPEPSTTFYYPITGIIGELQLVNIGIGFTLPFKVVGAPWIKAEQFAKSLNQQNLPGVAFHPFYYKPFYGKFSQQECQGALIIVTDPLTFRPVTTQYTLMGLLKSLYPKEFKTALEATKKNQSLFNKVNGTAKVLELLQNSPYPAWELRDLHSKGRRDFLKLRKKYLIPSYD